MSTYKQYTIKNTVYFISIYPGEEEIMEQMEKISETHTPYKEKISKDKYKFLCNLIKDKVSETEYEYFLSLKSIEEIRIFFEAKNRATLLVRIKHIIYT